MWTRKPDFIIGELEAPYLLRWWVIPRNRLFNIYLHKILRSDDDRALHDHPWWNVSVVLKGGYLEVLPCKLCMKAGEGQVEHNKLFYAGDEAFDRKKWRRAGSVVLRSAKQTHRLEILPGRHTWTLFLTGPRIRDWGFWCPKRGWRSHSDYSKAENAGEAGRGCD